MKRILVASLIALTCLIVPACGGKHTTVNTTINNFVSEFHNVYTPAGLNVVRIDDPNGLLASGVVKLEDLLSDLDYQILTFWYNSELNEPGHPDFTDAGLKNYAFGTDFVLVVDSKFWSDNKRVNGSVSLNVVFLATECFDAGGHRLAGAERAMDLMTHDPGENDNH